MTTIIDGSTVTKEVRDELANAIDALDGTGVKPGPATVLMSGDPASEMYVSIKQRGYGEAGIEAFDYELDPETPADELYSLVDDLNNDNEICGILIQMPVPDHVDDRAVLHRIGPAKGVDGFHPENVNRLVIGDARFKPCTPHGVQELLAATDVETEDTDVVVVGCSDIVGKPMVNLFIQKAENGNATIAVCHSRTDDLAAKTREADVVIAATGVPEPVTDNMLSEGVVVVDVGVNRVDADNEKDYEFVDDMKFDSAKEKTSAITPVPGGVGSMTRAMLLWSAVKTAAETESADVNLP